MKKIIATILCVGSILAMGCFQEPIKITEDKREAQVIYGQYCCDNSGYRRCVLGSPLPVGSGCWCYGQGGGWTCL